MGLSLTFFDEFQQVIMLIDCQEKSPTIISYDGIGEYEEMKLNMYDDEDENNNWEMKKICKVNSQSHTGRASKPYYVRDQSQGELLINNKCTKFLLQYDITRKK